MSCTPIQYCLLVEKKSRRCTKFLLPAILLIFLFQILKTSNVQVFIKTAETKAIVSDKKTTVNVSKIKLDQTTAGKSTSLRKTTSKVLNRQKTTKAAELIFPLNVTKAVRYSMPFFQRFLRSHIQFSIDHRNISFLSSPKSACEKQLDFLIIVHSALGSKMRRDVLRATISKYSKIAKLRYRVVFVVGTQPPKDDPKQDSMELSKFDDMLMINVTESYRIMTYKAVGWMKWMIEECKFKPKFILKIDDDILLNVPQLIHMLKPCFNNAPLPICQKMSCLFKPNEPALRAGKNKVTLDEYPLKGYPLFCPGMFYLFPAEMLPGMLDATKHVPFLWLDDVYVTAFIMVYMNKTLHSLNNFIIHPKEHDLSPLLKKKKMAAHFVSKNFQSKYISIWTRMIKNNKTQ